MICKKCGSEIPDDAKFCSKCGEKVQTDEAETSTQEKVSEFVVDLKKKVESSEKINEIKEKIASNETISELKEKIASNETISDLKEKIASNEKINELKEKIESNETINDLKENFSSKERLSTLMSNITATKIVLALLIILAAMKFFGGNEDLGLTPEEFQYRYNQNLDVLYPNGASNLGITGIRSEKFEDGSMFFEFVNKTKTRIVASALTGNSNIYNLTIYITFKHGDESDDLFLIDSTIAAHTITHENITSREDIFKTMEMIQELIGDTVDDSSARRRLGNQNTDKGKAEIEKDGINYLLSFSGNDAGLMIQTAKSAAMHKKQTR